MQTWHGLCYVFCRYSGTVGRKPISELKKVYWQNEKVLNRVLDLVLPWKESVLERKGEALNFPCFEGLRVPNKVYQAF